jgi:putative CocE/NonD family hydrolase
MKLLLCILFISLAASAQSPFTAPDQSPQFHGVKSSSRYVAMRDGVRIAVDIVLPEDLPAQQKLPALFKISSFGRSAVDGSISDEDRFWVQHGYARVLIDQRGTGASFGTSHYGPDTVPDLYDLVDWVVKQPWSNGRVGAMGVSVEGTASELLAATGHPAVRAVAPWFSDYNYYTDLVRPGGIFNEWLLKNFEAFTLQMDSGDSAKKVDADPDGLLMKQAIAEHRNNLDIYTSTRDAQFIDDPLAGTGKTLLQISIPGAAEALRRSKVPMLILASWYDAGTVQGTIERFHDFANLQRVFVGAWSHGAGFDADPFLAARPVQPSREQQWLEALQFFNHYLKDGPDSIALDRRFYYYTLGENAWHSTEVWPPRGLRTTTFSLSSTGQLALRASSGNRQVKLAHTSTGDSNRWHTQLGGAPVDYTAALKQMSALASFTSAPIESALEITGSPVLRLRIACSQQDPSVIAYLVATNPQGTSFYLTEGHLRLVNRKPAPSEQTLHTYNRSEAEAIGKDQEMEADITLLPTSVLVPKGDRVQLLLASGDDATFSTTGEYQVTISSSSQLELPTR